MNKYVEFSTPDKNLKWYVGRWVCHTFGLFDSFIGIITFGLVSTHFRLRGLEYITKKFE